MPQYEEYPTEAAALARLNVINAQLDYDRTGDNNRVAPWQTTSEWMTAPIESGGKWLVQVFTPPQGGLPPPPPAFGLSEAQWNAQSWSIDNRGDPAPSLAGRTRIFHCDFSDPSVVVDDHSNPLGGALFYTPGHPAQGQRHWESILTHPHLYEFLEGGGLRLHADVTSGTNYQCGAIQTANRFGRGRTFGNGVFVCDFKATHHLASFCAPMFLEDAIFATDNTVHKHEINFLEFDGNNRKYVNKGIHYDAPQRPRPGEISSDYSNHDQFDGELTIANGWHEDIDLYDTRHVLLGEVGDDWIVVCIDGQEVARYPVHEDIVEKRFVLLCAQQVKAGRLVAGENFSLTIYSVSVYE